MNKTKGKKQNKVAIVALAALLTVGIVAGSLAYFTTTSTFNNVFKVGAPGGKIVETFDNPSPSDLIAGGTFNKSAKAVNTGDTPIIARAKITAAWENGIASNTADGLTNGAAILNFGKTTEATADFTTGLFPFTNDIAESDKAATSTAKWFYDGAATGEKYFYYKDVLTTALPTSSALLKSVTLATGIGETTTSYELIYRDGTTDQTIKGATEQAVKATFATDYGTAHPGTKYTLQTVTTAKYPTYAGKTLTVTITGDVIQADQDALTASGWVVPADIKTGWGLK